MKYLTDYLTRNARDFHDKAAYVNAGTTLSWSELSARVDAAAARLLEYIPFEGRAPVSIMLPNSWQFVVGYWAVVRSGNMAAPLDVSFPDREAQAILSQIPPVAIITTRELRDRLGEVSVPVLFVEDFATGLNDASGHSDLDFDNTPKGEALDYAASGPELNRGDARKRPRISPLPALTIAPDQLEASLVFTSGTTGAPKAAPNTHSNHIWNIEASTKLYEWTADDTLLLSLPLSHWHGLVMGLSGALINANTTYLQERFSAKSTLEMLASGKISLFMHVSLAYMKLAVAEQDAVYDLSGVRLCISASSALPPSSWTAFRDRFGLEILECYGSSEAGRIASNTLTERIPGSPGRPMPSATLRISDSGEVEISSAGIFPGYYHNPEATARDTTPDGFWRTGDLGELTPEGHVRLKGRKQEKIKKLGYSLYPRDLEWAVTRGMPQVREIFVLGVATDGDPSDKLAYFVSGEGVTEQDVTQFCRASLHRAWLPDRVIVLDAIPRTRSGKPVLPKLREMAAAALAA